MAHNSLFRACHSPSFICQLLILIAIFFSVRVIGVFVPKWKINHILNGLYFYELRDSGPECRGPTLNWEEIKSIDDMIGNKSAS